MKSVVLLVSLAMVAIIAASSVPAAAQSYRVPQDGRWHNSLTTGLWLSGASGDMNVGGTNIPVDLSVGDAFDLLDDVETGICLHYEGGKNLTSYFLDVVYYKFEFNGQTQSGPGKLEPSQLISELGATYTLSRTQFEPGLLQTFAVLGGVRYTRQETDVSVPGAALDEEVTHDWADGFVGARYTRDLSQKWALGLRGDVGAGGSDFTWNFVGRFQYQLSTKRTLDLGWRILHQKYETGSGSSLFKWDVDESGPFLGTTMTW